MVILLIGIKNTRIGKAFGFVRTEGVFVKTSNPDLTENKGGTYIMVPQDMFWGAY